jgi:hypothetical protein
MNITDEQLDRLIQQTQYARPNEEPEFWFSYSNQKILAFELARDLVVQGEEIDDAISTAMTFIDSYFAQAVTKGAWERKNNRQEGT